MMGNDESVIKSFEAGRRSGAHVAAPAILFPAVAHHGLEKTVQANAMMAELQARWSNFSARFPTQRIFPLDVDTSDYVLSDPDQYGY